MATKIAISIGHLQEIRQQKSSALAFSAKAGHKLEEPINNLFHTIQTTCGLNAHVFVGKPTLCYQASHHCMTGQNRDSFPFPIWGSKKRLHPYCRSAAKPEYKSSVGRGYSFRCPRCTTLFPLYKSRCIVRKKSRKPMGVICNFVIASIVE